MSFRGYFFTPIHARVTGFSKQGGDFWIGFINDDDTNEGIVRVELTVPSDESPKQKTYASIHIHYDSLKVLRHLESIGFLAIFEEIKASNFYDLVQCCARCDIPIVYHGDTYTKEVVSRKMYELLYLND